MQEQDIHAGIREQIERWSQFRERLGRRYVLTDGAVEALVLLIRNVAEDPSPRWRDFDREDAQRFGIALLPNVLNELTMGMVSPIRREQVISSWELWHGLSRALDRWCFIPKDV